MKIIIGDNLHMLCKCYTFADDNMAKGMQKRSVAAIVAIDEAGAIGRDGGLLCRLPDDMKHFKRLTTGHSIIMGRKTFESFPKGALPERQNIVITRNRRYRAEGIVVARDLDQALALANLDGEVFIIGGAQVYALSLDQVDTIYLTRIHHTFTDADTFFPPLDETDWEASDAVEHPADDRHPYPFTFVTLRRRRPVGGEWIGGK